MNRGARVLGAVAFVGALLAATTATPGAATPAHARPHQAADHRAAVIIDTGAGVKKICIHFAEASISGLEALQRANATPVVQTFGGIGGAVCALCGRGCPAGNTCLTCGAPNYWAYFRAPAGVSGFTYSRAGANSTSVHDGDVEGWRWGTGAPPGYIAVAQVCGEVAPGSAGNGGGQGGGGGGQGGGAGSGGAASTKHAPQAPGTPAVGGAVPPSAASTSSAPPATVEGATAERNNSKSAGAGKHGRATEHAVAPILSKHKGGSSAGLLAFAAILSALVASVIIARQVRKRRAAA
jgi:hypothetical protein